MKFFNFENAVKQNHFVNLNDVKSDWTVSEEHDGITFSQSWKAWIFFSIVHFQSTWNVDQAWNHEKLVSVGNKKYLLTTIFWIKDSQWENSCNYWAKMYFLGKKMNRVRHLYILKNSNSLITKKIKQTTVKNGRQFFFNLKKRKWERGREKFNTPMVRERERILISQWFTRFE